VRERKAQKMGFSAYAISADMNDPVVKAIHGLLDHTVVLDQRVELILAQLKKMGVEMESLTSPQDQFDANYLNKIVD
jgi:serine O-acetyltransferase